MSDDAQHARATSSMTMADAIASAPTPPYASGTCTACRSAEINALLTSQGNSPVSSISAARGAILSSATLRTVLRSSWCSSGSTNVSNAGFTRSSLRALGNHDCAPIEPPTGGPSLHRMAHQQGPSGHRLLICEWSSRHGEDTDDAVAGAAGAVDPDPGSRRAARCARALRARRHFPRLGADARGAVAVLGDR